MLGAMLSMAYKNRDRLVHVWELTSRSMIRTLRQVECPKKEFIARIHEHLKRIHCASKGRIVVCCATKTDVVKMHKFCADLGLVVAAWSGDTTKWSPQQKMEDFKDPDGALRFCFGLFHTSCFTVAIDPKTTEVDQIYMTDGCGGASVRDFIQSLCRWGRDKEAQLLKSKVIYFHLACASDDNDRGQLATHIQANKRYQGTSRVYTSHARTSALVASQSGQQGADGISFKPEDAPMRQLATLSEQERMDGGKPVTRLKQWEQQATKKGWSFEKVKGFEGEPAPTTLSTVGAPRTWIEEVRLLDEVKDWGGAKQYLYAVIEASKCSKLQELDLNYFGDGPDTATLQAMRAHYCCNDGDEWQQVWSTMEQLIVQGFGPITIPMRALLEGAKERGLVQRLPSPTEHHEFVLQMVERRAQWPEMFYFDDYTSIVDDADQREKRFLDHLDNHLPQQEQGGVFIRCDRDDASATEREAELRQHYCGGRMSGEEWQCTRIDMEARICQGHQVGSTFMNDVLEAAKDRGAKQGVAKSDLPREHHWYTLRMIERMAERRAEWQEAAIAIAHTMVPKKKGARDRTQASYLKRFKAVAIAQAKWRSFLGRVMTPTKQNRFFRTCASVSEEGTIEHAIQNTGHGGTLERAVLEDVCRTLAPIKSFGMAPHQYAEMHKRKDTPLLQMRLLAFHRSGLTAYQVKAFVGSLQRKTGSVVCPSRGAKEQPTTMLLQGLQSILDLLGVSMREGSIVGERAPCHRLHYARGGGGFEDLTPTTCYKLWQCVLKGEVRHTPVHAVTCVHMRALSDLWYVPCRRARRQVQFPKENMYTTHNYKGMHFEERCRNNWNSS